MLQAVREVFAKQPAHERRQPKKKAKRALPPPSSGQAAPHDDEQLDEVRAHKTKVGRWIRETIESLQQPALWPLMRVLHRCRAPLHHVLNFLHTTMVTKLASSGNTDEAPPHSLPSFVEKLTSFSESLQIS